MSLSLLLGFESNIQIDSLRKKAKYHFRIPDLTPISFNIKVIYIYNSFKQRYPFSKIQRKNLKLRI